jgi:plastocyanin
MKKSLLISLASLLPLLTASAQDHTVLLQGLSFVPNNLTILAGETVAFVNQGGSHNVNGSQQSYPDNPESFSSGAVAPAPWTYTHTFNVPGVYQYHCDPHFSLGMTGTIIVQSAGSNPDVVITEIMYNNPGSDSYEFVELYNRGAESVQLENWTISDAIDYTFPAYLLEPASYVVVALNKDLFDQAFGTNSLDWDEANNNVLNNTGETIILSDAQGGFVDSVAYSDSNPWPTEPDGLGSSLVLCDVNADNDLPTNWSAATTPTGFSVGGVEILANPESASQCPAGAVISILNTDLSLLENAGNVFIRIALINGNADPTDITVSLEPGSTATPGADFDLVLPQTITFAGGLSTDTVTLSLLIQDDTEIESTETVHLSLSNPTNGAIVAPAGGSFHLSILDNDAPVAAAMVITGVYDTQVQSGGTWTKGAEFQAVQDIPDLSIYGVGFANNGGGSDGLEVPLPAMSLAAGECIWVANDSSLFFDFFGFYPTVTATAAGINGDDAIELFENNIVIDVFGEINHSGGALPWAYTDGWAYRQSGTGPDAGSYQPDHWNFSGVDAFDLVANNATAANPFPTCSYSVVPPVTAVANDDFVSTPFETPVTIAVLNNDITPIPVVSVSVTADPGHGTLVPLAQQFLYSPDAGFCGEDQFTYTVCDAVDCDEATVTISVECPLAYPPYSIGTVTSVNNNGAPDSLGRTCQLQGVVHGVDFRGGTGLSFTLIDGTGGINVYSPVKEFGYAVQEGDELIVQGIIDQYACLTEIIPDTLWLVSQGNDLQDPFITTFLNETFESRLVELTNLELVDPAEWTGTGPGFNVQVTNGTFTNIMRIDNDCELYSLPAPTGLFHARGIGGHFDTAPCDDGFQFFPRYAADIIPLNNAATVVLSGSLTVYPNPANDRLFFSTSQPLTAVTLVNSLGQVVLQRRQPGRELDISQLQPGLYSVFAVAGDQAAVRKIVKH